jgi:hypothetical protein
MSNQIDYSIRIAFALKRRKKKAKLLSTLLLSDAENFVKTRYIASLL